MYMTLKINKYIMDNPQETKIKIFYLGSSETTGYAPWLMDEYMVQIDA